MSAMVRWFVMMFLCVSITPLGWPVVPEVYSKKARSSSAQSTISSKGSAAATSPSMLRASGVSAAPITSTCSQRGAAAVASATRGARSELVMASLASEWSSTCAISRGPHCGVTGTMTAPSRQTAWKHANTSGRFGIITGIRSPGATPAARSAAAIRAPYAACSRRVHTRSPK